MQTNYLTCISKGMQDETQSFGNSFSVNLKNDGVFYKHVRFDNSQWLGFSCLQILILQWAGAVTPSLRR